MTPKDDNFISYLKALNPEPKPERQRGGKQRKKRPGTQHTDNREAERLNKKVRALFPVYSARLEILSRATKNEQITDQQLKHAWQCCLTCLRLRLRSRQHLFPRYGRTQRHGLADRREHRGIRTCQTRKHSSRGSVQ